MFDSRKKREKEVYNSLKGRGKTNYYVWDKKYMGELYSIRRDFHTNILNRFVRGKKALILGCGQGYGTGKLLKYGAVSVTGIDISDRLIQLARTNYASSNACFIIGDAGNMPFDNDSFDIVYCKAILHHLNLPAALSEIRRVLVPHGYLYVADECGMLNPLAWMRRSIFPSEIHTPDERPFIPYYFRKSLSRNGFNEICFEYRYIVSPIVPVLAKLIPSIDWSKLLVLCINIDRLISRTFFKQLCWRIGGLYQV